jgi:hypothetical protein
MFEMAELNAEPNVLSQGLVGLAASPSFAIFPVS